jgi:diguanylate cyclase (GGDEF)-like protein
MVLLGFSFVRGKSGLLNKRCFFFMLCICLWQAFDVLYFCFQNESAVRFMFLARYIPVTFMPVAYLYYCVEFYHMRNTVPRWLHIAIFAFPSFMTVLTLSPAAFLVVDTTSVKIENGMTEISYRYGFFFYTVLLYLLAIYVLIFMIVIRNFRILPAAYRRGSFFHMLYLLIFLFVEIYHFTVMHGEFGEVYFFGMSIGGFLFYLSHVLNSKNSGLNMDQNSIFDFLDHAVFILNENGVVVQTNRPATLWLKSLKRGVENVAFDGLLSVLSNNHRIVVKPLEDSSDFDIHITNTAIPMIYRMERRKFVAKDKISKGEFITLTDVTSNRLLIDRLRDMAGVDALTGLANRYRYQDLLRKLDRAENYPLAVVIGDVNGLKYVNDNFGHQEGDEYLKEIGHVMQQCCPKEGYVARYGGDEFATLLAKSPPEAVQKYIDSVHEELRRPRNMKRQPSISLGYAIKYHGNENLNNLIAEADKLMYAEKEARRNAAI